ncbi:MAG: hypothetical protein K8H84_12355 [Sulfuricella denitrificans]|nr:hypothetical protein [Sulfuricella denitrificans]
MSLLLRKEWRAVLSPDQLVLVSVAREFTRRGLVRRVLASELIHCDPAASGEAPWEGAVRTLEAALSGMAKCKDAATLVLSSHFMRYLMVPWSDALSSDAEQLAYALHCFRQAYGPAAEHWELRLSPGPAGLPQLASAVDARLLQALRTAFSSCGVLLTSLQPGLMAAYNNCRARLRHQSAWFVLYEPGCLCLALLQHGHWSSVRNMRVGADWREQLPNLLERESCMGVSESVPEGVFVWAPTLENMAFPDSGRWQMQYLQPLVQPGLVQAYEGRFAMALSG